MPREPRQGDRESTIQRIEEGDAWDETDEVVEFQVVKKPLDKVVPVRMPSDRWNELRREASERGIGPSTLARMWILEKLREGTVTKKPA